MSDIGIFGLLPKDLLRYFAEKYLNEYDTALFRSTCSKLKDLVKIKRSLFNQCDLTCHAAENGYVNMLEWLVSERSQKWHEPYSEGAAGTGRIDVLEWIKKNKDKLAYPFSKYMAESAARNGHLHVLEWMRKEKLSYHDRYQTSAAEGGHLEILKWSRLNDRCCQDTEQLLHVHAALGGHLEVLIWIKKKKLYWKDRTVTSLAAERGHVHILKWAKDEGCTLGENICDLALEHGHFEATKWLCQQGYTFTERKACTRAASACSVEMMQWLTARGGEWTEKTFEKAVIGAMRRNNYDLVKYLWENECSVYLDICNVVAKCDDARMLEWLIEEGFEFRAKSHIAGLVNEPCMNVLIWLSKRDSGIKTVVLNYIGCHPKKGHEKQYDERMMRWLKSS